MQICRVMAQEEDPYISKAPATRPLTRGALHFDEGGLSEVEPALQPPGSARRHHHHANPLAPSGGSLLSECGLGRAFSLGFQGWLPA